MNRLVKWILKCLLINNNIIRDRFILGLRTRLRISDWSVFEKESIIKDVIATMPNKKTRKKVAFPLPAEYFERLEKYKGSLPKQLFMRTTIGGEPINKKYEKWELISHHTSRYSVVSLMLKEHDSITVESIVGMSAMAVRKYDKRTRTEIVLLQDVL